MVSTPFDILNNWQKPLILTSSDLMSLTLMMSYFIWKLQQRGTFLKIFTWFITYHTQDIQTILLSFWYLLGHHSLSSFLKRHTVNKTTRENRDFIYLEKLLVLIWRSDSYSSRYQQHDTEPQEHTYEHGCILL